MCSSRHNKGSCDNIMAIFDSHQKWTCCREKGLGSNHYVLGQEDCPACTLLTPDQVQQLSVPAYKNRKDKKKDKPDKAEKGDKLVNPSSVIVIGPSTSTMDKMESSDISSTKASNPASSQPCSGEFADFNDQLSSLFTRLESSLSLSLCASRFSSKTHLLQSRFGVSHSPKQGSFNYSFHITTFNPY